MAFVEQALGLTEPSDVLDLCCGPGRHSVRLAQRGHHVTGVDISAYNLEKAAERAAEFGVDVTWREADMRATGLGESSQDAAINMFTAFGFFDDAGNQRVLEEVARVLRPGGTVSHRPREPGLADAPPPASYVERATQRRAVVPGARVPQRDRNQTTKWNIISADGERISQSFTVRVYTLQELEVRMAQAGLEVEDAWGGLDGSELTMDSHRLVVLARAK